MKFKFVCTDEVLNVDVYQFENKLYYDDGGEIVEFAQFETLFPSGYFEVYMDGRFWRFDSLACLAVRYMRSADMRWKRQR
jgi:hypothetical protein